jgi:hypothetical protein
MCIRARRALRHQHHRPESPITPHLPSALLPDIARRLYSRNCLLYAQHPAWHALLHPEMAADTMSRKLHATHACTCGTHQSRMVSKYMAASRYLRENQDPMA